MMIYSVSWGNELGANGKRLRARRSTSVTLSGKTSPNLKFSTRQAFLKDHWALLCDRVLLLVSDIYFGSATEPQNKA